MRLRGLVSSYEATICSPSRSTIEDCRSATAMVVQDVMPTQHGIADDLHGLECSGFLAGNVCADPSWCAIDALPVTDAAWRD